MRYDSSYYSSNANLVGSFSKDVKYGKVDDNCMGFDLDICPDLLLAGLALAAAGAFVALFTAITMQGRKKKRSTDEFLRVPFTQTIQDLYWMG